MIVDVARLAIVLVLMGGRKGDKRFEEGGTIITNTIIDVIPGYHSGNRECSRTLFGTTGLK